jgi:hypothetical protein
MHNFHTTHHITDNRQNDKLDNFHTYVHSMYDSLCRGVNVDYVCLSAWAICELVVCLDGSWYEWLSVAICPNVWNSAASVVQSGVKFRSEWVRVVIPDCSQYLRHKSSVHRLYVILLPPNHPACFLDLFVQPVSVLLGDVSIVNRRKLDVKSMIELNWIELKWM